MVFCENCGAKLRTDSRFCENCGAKVPQKHMTQETEEETVKKIKKQITPQENDTKIRLCPDGKYRWIYELDMGKNPVLYQTILKVLAISALFPAGLVTLTELRSGLKALTTGCTTYAIVFGIFLVLSPIAYAIVAAGYGGKYIVLFEMDEDGVIHNQQDKQFDKAQGIGWLLLMYGGAKKSVGRVGQGIMVASHNTTSSDFIGVKKVIGLRKHGTIKLSSTLTHNQVYVDKDDYDFVWEYITSRCINAKIRA